MDLTIIVLIAAYAGIFGVVYLGVYAALKNLGEPDRITHFFETKLNNKKNKKK